MNSPASAARSCSAKVLASTARKADVVARLQQEDRIAMQLIGADRRPSQQMPAARTGEALYAGLYAADRDGAGRRQQPRILPPRHVQRLLQPAEIGPAGRKADHRDAVVAGGVPRHDLVRRRVEGFGDVFEVDAVLAAIDHRNAPAPGICRRRDRPLRQGKDLFAEFFETDLHGIVMHQQRAIGRHGLGDPGHRLGRHGPVERQNPPVGGVIDVAAEFHRDGAVATRQKAGRG